MRHEPSRSVETPEPGHFVLRLVRGGPQVAARIVHDDTGWWAEINATKYPAAADPFEAEGIARIWHYGRRVDVPEYEYRLKLAAWAREHDPDHPMANPERPVSPNATKPVF